MRKMKLRELIDSDDLTAPDLQVKGIAYDSRNVRDGYVFVARRGASEFVQDAVRNGAAFLILEEDLPITAPKLVVRDARKSLAALAQKFYGDPSKRLKVVGITGTFGKTTSTWLLKSIYETSGIRTGMIGTIQHEIGNKKIRADRTTPESLDLQRMFSEFVQDNAKAVVLEVSSHGISLSRVCGTDFDIAGFTRLDRDHLDFHKTIEEYKNTKLKLFSSLKTEGIAVLNRDDPTFDEFSEKTKAKVVSYGTARESDIRGEIHSQLKDGIEINMKWNGRKERMFSPLLGAYNLHNVLLASTCALESGIDFGAIREGIAKLSCVPGRFERMGHVVVDYAHTPGALRWALHSAREIAQNRVVCIFGCGGDRDQGKRPEMGKIASELADHVILTTDNPRNEDPASIAEDTAKEMDRKNYEIILDRREAIRRGIEQSSPEDIVLVVGKGHENYQIYGDRKEPWDDKEIVRQMLKESNPAELDGTDND